MKGGLGKEFLKQRETELAHRKSPCNHMSQTTPPMKRYGVLLKKMLQNASHGEKFLCQAASTSFLRQIGSHLQQLPVRLRSKYLFNQCCSYRFTLRTWTNVEVQCTSHRKPKPRERPLQSLSAPTVRETIRESFGPLSWSLVSPECQLIHTFQEASQKGPKKPCQVSFFRDEV